MRKIGMNSDELNDFGQRYERAWCSQSAASVAAFYAEDGSLKINGGEAAVGRSEIASAAQEFMTDFPDMVVTMTEIRCEADRVIWCWTMTGTNSGPGGTGSAVSISGFESMTFDEDGLIDNCTGHFDEAEFQRQLNPTG
jgi:steroid delta-isomerase-like uncharacterized protein